MALIECSIKDWINDALPTPCELCMGEAGHDCPVCKGAGVIAPEGEATNE